MKIEEAKTCAMAVASAVKELNTVLGRVRADGLTVSLSVEFEECPLYGLHSFIVAETAIDPTKLD